MCRPKPGWLPNPKASSRLRRPNPVTREGLPRYDLRGARYEMKNGQGTPTLRLDGSRVPIPWLMSAAGWGLFIGQPSGFFDLSGHDGVFSPVAASATASITITEPLTVVKL